MSQLFLASHPGDRSRVARIAEGLRKAGLSVAWDAEMVGKPGWRREVEEQVDRAECVVVVWSRVVSAGGSGGNAGSGGDVVMDLAVRGKARGVLVALRIDEVEPPVGFGDVPVVDLAGWRGRGRNRRFQELLAQIRAVAAGEARPGLAGGVRRKRFVARWLGVVGFSVALVGFLADAFGAQALGCKVPGVHQVCGSLGLGGVATAAERSAWEARRPGDCEALREHAASFPTGAFAQEGARRLTAAEVVIDESWTPEEQRPALRVDSGNQPFANETAARVDALERGRTLAEDACAGYRLGPFRLLSASAEASAWTCRPRAGGIVCAFDGQAVCKVEALHRIERTVCP